MAQQPQVPPATDPATGGAPAARPKTGIPRNPGRHDLGMKATLLFPNREIVERYYVPLIYTACRTCYSELEPDEIFRRAEGGEIDPAKMQKLISGVIERAYAKGTARLDHFLEVRPFPRDIADPEQRARIWEEFRKGLLSLSGIAFFFFGNKIVAGQTVLADGVLKEFEIASDQGAALLPVGATGWMAAHLAAKMLEAEGDAPPAIIEAVRALNQPVERISQLIQPITDAIRAIAAN